MFEVEVFSNPLNAVVGEGGFLHHDDYSSVTRYDEELIKPALLLGDYVHLRSHRLDLLRGEQRDLDMTGRFSPVYAQLVGLSKRRDANELAFLGVSIADLLTDDEIAYYARRSEEEHALRERLEAVPYSTNVEALRTQKKANRAQLAPFDEDWQRLLDRAEPVVRALRARLNESISAFQSDTLDDLTDRGLLFEDPWDDLPKSRPRQIQDALVGPNAEYERAFNAMVDDLVHSTSSVMLDEDLRTAIASAPAGVASVRGELVVSGAVELMRMVEGVGALPLDEVADVREELRDYIDPFRSFMIEVSSGVQWDGASDEERARLLKLAWETDVAPAIRGMEVHVRSGSFIRNAIDVFSEGGTAFQAVGLAVGTWAAAGLVGFSTISASVGAAPPLLKAIMKSVRAREVATRNRAYLVHALPRSKAVKRAIKRAERA